MTSNPQNSPADRSGNRADVRDFLVSRRARITPEQAGLPVSGVRRVPGLRREEVAVLAGVSTEWYVRLEKGHITGVSEDVLEAVARTLQLDDEERIYLFDLARASRPADRTRAEEPTPQLPPNIQWMLESMTLSAAMVANKRHDILAVNPLGRALHAPVFESSTTRERGHANLARYHFLDPGARDFYGDWNVTADVLVALLRAEAGRNPHERAMQDLVGELTTLSPEFRTRWATYNILIHKRGEKIFRHPDVGRLCLAYHAMELSVSVQTVVHVCVCTAAPGSAEEQKFKLLASWAAPAPHQTKDPGSLRS
ncbi:helix-turn-helix transcriptional regulator [Streptomyces sp. NBC_01476]|uniref:helix-turn-helix domain-containing protein n=1 Tax=Streptomyces sp. NBC_01476 TaxID=2903881 RepID=UPI002E364632|nr:helix-turn-helix transcriptional regulator [Streptomyces sp. NBC_01476]